MDTKQLDELKKPLPPEAIAQHPTKPYLSTIKVIYIVERLNEVFGLGGWKVENEWIETERIGDEKKPYRMVVIKAKFTAGEIYDEAYGGNDNQDLGDAYKGACTDALSKIASYLYVGMDVYKGLADAPVSPKTAPGRTKLAKTDNPMATVCEHGLEAKRVMSKSAANPNRWFLTCPNPKATQCKYFQWEDEIGKGGEPTNSAEKSLDEVNMEVGYEEPINY